MERNRVKDRFEKGIVPRYRALEEFDNTEIEIQPRPNLKRLLKEPCLLMKPVPSRMWDTGKEANVMD